MTVAPQRLLMVDAVEVTVIGCWPTAGDHVLNAAALKAYQVFQSIHEWYMML